MMYLKALEFAAKKHEGQVRRGNGIPYVCHPISVAYILQTHKESKVIDELMCAAVLHDTLEDTDTNFDELQKEFSPLIASLVLELTSDPEQIKEIGKNEYLIKKMCGMSSYALVIKLADRLSNVRDNPSDSYCVDTENMIEALSNRRMLSASQESLIREIERVLAERKCDV